MSGVRALCSLVAALCWSHAAASGEPEQPAVVSRDALWRHIFARPAPSAPAGEQGAMAERISLGHDLFRDQRLSGRGDRSCATCHEPARAFTDGRARARGLDGAPLQRNVPALFNLAWGRAFYWDGRAPSLEAQARFPILAANELAGDFASITGRLGADAVIRERFARAFPEAPPVSETNILAAIAAYERTLVSPPTRFDRWVSGDDTALSAEEHAGFAIFVGRGGCVACHGGWRLTDDAFHDIGLATDDPGRGAVAGGVPGLAQFKTPGLRELRQTAPYMHDGSLPTLAAVVDHYAGGFIARPSLAANIRRDLTLTAGEKSALVAFLLTLSADGNEAR
jgi:cytochrome c peroxidase